MHIYGSNARNSQEPWRENLPESGYNNEVRPETLENGAIVLRSDSNRLKYRDRISVRQNFDRRRLKALAKRQGISVAELIRRAVDRASDAALAADEEEVRARALTVIGKYADTAPDVSEEHDRYLAEAVQE